MAGSVLASQLPEVAAVDGLVQWMDLNVMVLATGRERTVAEFSDLLDQAGFAREQIVSSASPLSIVVGKPMA
jgi:hypothetical protein